MMDRRKFLMALAAAGGSALAFDEQKRRRVGLIGTGWYGKSDLFRLIQIAPVEVVSLCDVDKRMLSEAADMVAERQVSKKRPRCLQRLSRDAEGEGSGYRRSRYAGSLARVDDDRSCESGRRCLLPETHQRGCRRRSGHAGRGAQTWARRCRSGRSDAALRIWSRRATPS